MEGERTFADVILALPLPKLYTYTVPFELVEKIAVGKRAVVQFGKKKVYTAIIKAIHHEEPIAYKAKVLLAVIDEQPIVSAYQLGLWDWMSSYYLCTLGEVMSTALPAALKLESETRICLNDYDRNILADDKEHLIIEALENKKDLTLNEVFKIVEQKNVMSIINSLVDKGIIRVREEIKEYYKPKQLSYVKLNTIYQEDIILRDVFNTLEKKSPKQLEFLMKFMSLVYQNKNVEGIPKKELLAAGLSSSTLTQLIKKKILQVYKVEVDRLIFNKRIGTDPIKLTQLQLKALEEINNKFINKDVILLHGVTSSGKTEIYIHLIEKTLKEGKQVLYLLPEIALTAQIIVRLQKHFGASVGVYHSKYSDNERVEVWKKVLNANEPSSYSIVIGARSAIFLPFTKLGLIIVDEEHDASFKQQNPAPRYSARDTAILLAQLHKAKIILGSATPSIESYHNALKKKYELVELQSRYGGVIMPEFIVVNMREEIRKKLAKSHFSSVILKSIKEALEQKEQVILFQNRRGFIPVMECVLCGWVPSCVHCDVSLTYHKQFNQLRCHYCGYTEQPVKACKACGGMNFHAYGFGTEKIEDEMEIFFPEANIARMDLDSTRHKNAYHEIINKFENKEIDILVGTQMVTKGLDFGNVSTVGILNADSMINYPDFRAFERSFQLLTQVAGRSGRKQKRGKVILQTYNPKHIVIQNVINNNYKAMYEEELFERNKFKYPPFYRLIQLTINAKDIDILNLASDLLANDLRKSLGSRVLGPEFPLVSRVKNRYLKNILIKIEKQSSLQHAKSILVTSINNFKLINEYRQVHIAIDIDPA